LQAYKIAKANEVNFQNQLDQLIRGLKSGLSPDVANLQLAITNKIAGDTSLVSAKYSYYIALGVLNRSILDGPYLDILTQVDGNKNAQRP